MMNISDLPINQNSKINPDDIRLLDQIFGEVDTKINTEVLGSSLRSPLIVALLVGFMLHPLSDSVISKITTSENLYSKMLIKMALAAVLFFMINYWSLARK